MPVTDDIFPYQEEGAEYLAGRARRGLPRSGLFDEPGAGKTRTFIRGADKINARRIVVVTPAGVREHWRNEFMRWQAYGRRICKGQNIHDFQAWQLGRFDVLVTSYEQMAKWARYIEESTEIVDLVIFDEAHYLKDEGTTRAKQFLGSPPTGFSGLMAHAAVAWWGTGSPIPNDPADIYTFLRFVGVMPLERSKFVNRYFASRLTSYGTKQQVKDPMLREIQTLIGNNSITRKLADVGYQLPPIFITNFFIDGDAQAVRDMLLAQPGLDRAIIEALEGDKGFHGLNTEHIATLRRLIGEAKALPYAQVLLGELQGGLEKVVFFGIHKAALVNAVNYLTRNGVRVGLINGDTPEKDRVTYVKAFQEERSMQVMALQMRSGGTGLTLHAAAAEDVLESDWAPYVNHQAIKRIHRIGQTRVCRARFITLANSFDTVVNSIVAAKTAAIAEIEGAPIVGGAAPIAA